MAINITNDEVLELIAMLEEILKNWVLSEEKMNKYKVLHDKLVQEYYGRVN